MLLTTSDVGEASASLDGIASETVAGRLVREMTAAAIVHSDVP